MVLGLIITKRGPTLGQAPDLTHKHLATLERLAKRQTLYAYYEILQITAIESFMTLCPVPNVI